MATAVLQANVNKKENQKKESLFTRICNAYREYPEIVCGYLAVNGGTNVYPLYRELKRQ